MCSQASSLIHHIVIVNLKSTVENLKICSFSSDLVANMARREEKVAASSFRALSSFLSFVMVSVTMDFSASYLLFRLARAPSAVWVNIHTHSQNINSIFSVLILQFTHLSLFPTFYIKHFKGELCTLGGKMKRLVINSALLKNYIVLL